MAKTKKRLNRSRTKHFTKTDTHLMVRRSLIGYSVLVFVLFFLLASTIHLFLQLAENKTNTERLTRIQSIYSSLQLGNDYRPSNIDVFGDKRPYEGHPEFATGRSHSSKIEYGHNDTPSNTRADLRKKIETAGFKWIDEVYEQSVAPQDHYKNDDGEYIRVTVQSARVQHNILYGLTSDEPMAQYKDEAPTYVTTKVNLDDNNE